MSKRMSRLCGAGCEAAAFANPGEAELPPAIMNPGRLLNHSLIL